MKMEAAAAFREPRLPLNSSELQLYKILQRANLLCYFDHFVAQGGDDVSQLLLADEDEFLEIMTLVGMAGKPLHVRRLQKALQEWLLKPGIFKSPVVNSNPSIADTLPKELIISVMKNEVPLPASVINCPIDLKNIGKGLLNSDISLLERGTASHTPITNGGCKEVVINGQQNGVSSDSNTEIEDSKTSSVETLSIMEELTEPQTIEAKPAPDKFISDKSNGRANVEELFHDIPQEKMRNIREITEALCKYLKENWKSKSDTDCKREISMQNSDVTLADVPGKEACTGVNNTPDPFCVGSHEPTPQQKIMKVASYFLSKEFPSLTGSTNLLIPLSRQVYHMLEMPPLGTKDNNNESDSPGLDSGVHTSFDIHKSPPIRLRKRMSSYIEESLANTGLSLVLDETIASIIQPKKIKITHT